MTDINNFFNDDPWANISEPLYPNGQSLYEQDERFYVSMNASEQLVFFVIEPGRYNVENLPTLSGIEISIDKDFDGETRLICALTEPLLKDKFAIVAKEVAYSNTIYEGDQFLEECKNRIISWAEFLKPSRKGLRKSEWYGFWGELFTLTQIISPIIDFSDAVKFWVGPDGKKQDFTFNDSALEIKTTLSADANLIKISSLDQLHRITEKLYLMQLHINYSNDERALSLRDMYERAKILSANDTDTKMKFLHKTSKLYGKASEIQLEQKFNYLGKETYDVNDSFPKLTNENTQSAISAVKYDLNPSSLKSCLVDLDLEDILKP